MRGLEADLASGKLQASAASGEAAPKRAAKPAAMKAGEKAAKPSLPPVPADAKGVWDRAMETLSKTEPPLFGLLRNERFIGVKGNVYQVLIPAAKKEFSYVHLNQQARREKVAKALSEAAGEPVLFEAVLESDVGKRQDAALSEAQQSLINAFGREMVQIDEEQQQ